MFFDARHEFCRELVQGVVRFFRAHLLFLANAVCKHAHDVGASEGAVVGLGEVSAVGNEVAQKRVERGCGYVRGVERFKGGGVLVGVDVEVCQLDADVKLGGVDLGGSLGGLERLLQMALRPENESAFHAGELAFGVGGNDSLSDLVGGLQVAFDSGSLGGVDLEVRVGVQQGWVGEEVDGGFVERRVQEVVAYGDGDGGGGRGRGRGVGRAGVGGLAREGPSRARGDGGVVEEGVEPAGRGGDDAEAGVERVLGVGGDVAHDGADEELVPQGVGERETVGVGVDGVGGGAAREVDVDVDVEAGDEVVGNKGGRGDFPGARGHPGQRIEPRVAHYVDNVGGDGGDVGGLDAAHKVVVAVDLVSAHDRDVALVEVDHVRRAERGEVGEEGGAGLQGV